MFRIASVHQQASYTRANSRNNVIICCTYDTSIVFCGIPHHSFNYYKILIVRDPLLRLKITRTISLTFKMSKNC